MTILLQKEKKYTRMQKVSGRRAVNYSRIFYFAGGSSNQTSAKARDEYIFGVEVQLHQFLNSGLDGRD
jgi:hypothetical protein